MLRSGVTDYSDAVADTIAVVWVTAASRATIIAEDMEMRAEKQWEAEATCSYCRLVNVYPEDSAATIIRWMRAHLEGNCDEYLADG